MAEIQLYDGQVALVDDSDVPLVEKYRWAAHRKGSSVYAEAYVRGVKPQRYIGMHNLIMGTGLIDHRNGNGLDNRRDNLRPATKSQNNWNRKKQDSETSSRFKGVSFHRGRWDAIIHVNGHRFDLGSFSNEEEAAIAYDEAAIKLHGEFAKKNYP